MKTSKTIILSSIIASLVLVGCGSDDSNSSNSSNTTSTPSTTDTRFSTMIMDTETVEVDNMKKVEWVGSVGKNQNACQPHAAATTESADIAGAKAHCAQLVFATHDDWRVATPAEHKEHVTSMEAVGKIPFYANPACPRLIGVMGSTATAVNTHNSTPTGGETTWANLINSTASNYGVKCIRSIENNNTAQRFTTTEMGGDTLEVDTQKGIEWVGSAGANGNAYQSKGAATTESADISGAETHCSQLVFATHDDWRVATPTEHKEHVTAMEVAGKIPFYGNLSSPRLIGVMGGTATAVNTHNSTPTGGETTWTNLLTQTATNYGVKCVRTLSTNTGMMP